MSNNELREGGKLNIETENKKSYPLEKSQTGKPKTDIKETLNNSDKIQNLFQIKTTSYSNMISFWLRR